jgi:hypothetical protein
MVKSKPKPTPWQKPIFSFFGPRGDIDGKPIIPASHLLTAKQSKQATELRHVEQTAIKRPATQLPDNIPAKHLKENTENVPPVYQRLPLSLPIDDSNYQNATPFIENGIGKEDNFKLIGESQEEDPLFSGSSKLVRTIHPLDESNSRRVSTSPSIASFDDVFEKKVS